MLLLNPNKHNRQYPDKESRDIMLKTIEFFENKGKIRLKNDDHERVWYQDFLDFVKKEKIFAKLLTPERYGDAGFRWDTWRIMEFNEILAFYGLHYWYAWQVSILGLGPIWMSKNEDVKKKTAKLLKEGGVFGFGLSEKEHGADLYSTETLLKVLDDGKYEAKGSKYYIGNGNKASLISIFAKTDKPSNPEDEKYGKYVFFVADSQHEKYECVRNLVNVQSYVAEFRLNDYPITEADILSKGRDAWDCTLNTVNVGKYNLGWASIGICTHAFYEAITHAANRNLYNMYVTDFPHIKQLFVDAYTRLIAMKLFALRAGDYIRTASREDRRYILYNSIVKMKVTSQGEDVINLLWDIIAARGFEAETYFSQATRDIRALPKLEGTVHVNMAQIIKFMPAYFFMAEEFPEIPKVDDAKDDDFLFNQGITKGLKLIRFHDYRTAYDSVDLPNVNIFKEQLETFIKFIAQATPNDEQVNDLAVLLKLGELFTIVVYGQLIIENARIYDVSDTMLDQIFDFIVRDFSEYALQLYSIQNSAEQQLDILLRTIRKPHFDKERFGTVWKEVYSLNDLYEMRK
ncbi:MAG: acyl-CoA dehydrogenase [Candidatus Bathyarchaeota archaeon]|nr:MAG: acyl-CoA dehydrogenase [Candidatus Bathyarchaeota archaeon]